MGRIDVVADRSFDEPVVLEGLPGVGLVGKIAVDHLVETLEMERYADVYCEALPPAAAYGADDRTLRTPVRLYAAPEADLLALQSDVPVPPAAAAEFAACLEGWLREADATPLYVAGLEAEDGEPEGPPVVRGVATGEGEAVLEGLDLPMPEAPGLVSGPTGALLAHALEAELTAVGLVVAVDPRFPDPAAARAVLADAVEPLTGVDVHLDALTERAQRIRQAKERLAQQVRGQPETASQARTLRMYQ